MIASPPLSPTSSPSDVRIGSQRPRVLRIPPGDEKLGREVVDFMAEVGRPLDPWQALCVRSAFAADPVTRLWAAFELLVLVSRQNGKGGVTEAIELGSMFLFREPLLMHSSHHFSTTRAAFQRVVDIIDASDWLRRRVADVSRSKGDESVTLTRDAGGSRLYFSARTLRAGRGLTGSKTIFDEAAWLTVGQYAAQTPTLATIPNPQIIYTTTPPDDEVGPMPEDAMLPSVRARGLVGGSRVAMFEWSPGADYDRTDRDLWYDCNPSLGIRITEEFLSRQLAAFTEAGKPHKYDTEHLGLWPDDAARQWQVIPEAAWLAMQSPRLQLADPVALGVDVTPDRTWSAIAAAGRLAGGGRGAETIEHRPGTAWVIPRLKELARRHKPCVIVTSDRAIADAAEEAGLAVYRAGSGDLASAASMFYDGVAGVLPDVWQVPDDDTTDAVAGATKRQLGDGWAWDRRSVSVNICPLVARSIALWGLGTPRVWTRGGAAAVASVDTGPARRQPTEPDEDVNAARIREQAERETVRS